MGRNFPVRAKNDTSFNSLPKAGLFSEPILLLDLDMTWQTDMKIFGS